MYKKELFLWTKCKHIYHKGCVKECMYEYFKSNKRKIPMCKYPNCTQQLKLYHNKELPNYHFQLSLKN